VPDPAAVRGSQAEIERAFRDAFLILDRRISLFLSLPLKTLDRLALKRELDNIGQTSNLSTTTNAAPVATGFER
jgi:arsenate reductase